jgi:hypothetical protein
MRLKWQTAQLAMRLVLDTFRSPWEHSPILPPFAICKTAGYVAYKLERKAKYGVRMIYEWANEASPESSNLATSSDPIKTGSTKTAFAQPASLVSQSTLHIEDLIPVWRGPKISKNS